MRSAMGDPTPAAPVGSVLETWISFYMMAGTASLFAHVTARSAGSRTLLIPRR